MDDTRTLTATIPLLIIKSGTHWVVVSSIAMFQTIPIIVFKFLILNNLVRGLTFGAVKGKKGILNFFFYTLSCTIMRSYIMWQEE